MRKISRGNYLYHYTTLDNFLQIWKDGSLKPTPQDHDTQPGVCLTRNPNMHLRWPHKGVKLTLDANKLNVSLRPFLHPNKENQPDFKYEAEERCYREIKGLLKYLVRVDLNINYRSLTRDRMSKVDKIRNNLEAFNIPYELSDLSSENLQNPEEVRKRSEPLNTEFLDNALIRLDNLVQTEDILSVGKITTYQYRIRSLVEDIDSYTPDVYAQGGPVFSMALDDVDYLRESLAAIEDSLYDYTMINDMVCFELGQIIQELKNLSTKVGKPLTFTKEENDLVFLRGFKIIKANKSNLNKIERYIRTRSYREDSTYNYSEFLDLARSLKEGIEYYNWYLDYLNDTLRSRDNYTVIKNKLTNYYQRKNRN